MWTASEKQDLAEWSEGEGHIKQNRQHEATELRKNIVCDETYKQFRGTESGKEGNAKQEDRSQFMEGFFCVRKFELYLEGNGEVV